MKSVKEFNPTYFLSALGAGGLSVSFYMYLMFLIPHKGFPMATFEHIFPVLTEGSLNSLLVAFAILGIFIFAFLHFKLLIWNIKQYNIYKYSRKYEDLMNSNARVTLMILPLTFAMTINIFFVLGAGFVPNLWSLIEYLFPIAILGFSLVGIFALKILLSYYLEIMINSNFSFEKNNSLSQLLAVFSLAMIAVGFAAPAAMSHHIAINAVAFFGAILFASFALFLTLIQITLGFKSILKQGLNPEASPSLWIMIPILTLLGIMCIRLLFGLEHNFSTPISRSTLFIFTSFVLSMQIVFGLLGYGVLKKNQYFKNYVYSPVHSSTSFALICPGVAFFVFGMFFINFGLVYNGIIPKYSIVHFALMMPFVYSQIITIKIFFVLTKKFNS